MGFCARSRDRRLSNPSPPAELIMTPRSSDRSTGELLVHVFKHEGRSYRCRQVSIGGMTTKMWMVSVDGRAGIPFALSRPSDLDDPRAFEHRVVAFFNPR